MTSDQRSKGIKSHVDFWGFLGRQNGDSWGRSVHGILEELQKAGALGRSEQGGEKQGWGQRPSIGRGKGGDSQGDGEQLEFMSIGVTWPDRCLKTIAPVAAWKEGGDQIGRFWGHPGVVLARGQWGWCPWAPPRCDPKSEGPGQKHRKVVLAGKNELGIIKQRWPAEECQFYRENGVSKDTGQENKDSVHGDSAVKWLEVVGLCALRWVIYFLIPQSLHCKIRMVLSPTSERHCNEMVLVWCLRGTQ